MCAGYQTAFVIVPAGRGQVYTPSAGFVREGGEVRVNMNGSAVAVHAVVEAWIEIAVNVIRAVRRGVNVAQIVFQAPGLLIDGQRCAIRVLCPAEQPVVLRFAAIGDGHEVAGAVHQIFLPVDIRQAGIGAQHEGTPVGIFRRNRNFVTPQLQISLRVEVGQGSKLFQIHHLRVSHRICYSFKAAVGQHLVFNRLRQNDLCDIIFGVVLYAGKELACRERAVCLCGAVCGGGGRCVFLRLLCVCLRVSQEAHGHGDRHKYRRQHDPERGLFVI